MRRYQGPDMPLLAHMLNLREPAFKQAQQPNVYQPLPSPVVAPHPSPDPMPLPPRQSLPPPIPFGPTTTSGVVSTEPILDIPSSFRPSKPVHETINSPFRDDDTGGGSLYESPPLPPPATLTISPTLPWKLNSRPLRFYTENEEEARQSKELDALLNLANAALHAPSLSTTLSKPANPEQSSEQEISPTTLDAVLTLSQSKARARATTIIYKHLKKQKSSSGLDFTDADIPTGGLDSAGGLVSAGGLDFAGGLDSASGLDSAGGLNSAVDLLLLVFLLLLVPLFLLNHLLLLETLLKAKQQELLEQELRQSINAKQVYLDSLLAQRVAEEQDRESMASEEQSTQRQAELDKVVLNLKNEEWIGLVDQVRAHPTLSAELLGADVSEDTFFVRMVELMNRRRKAIAEMKAKAKREKPMTTAQQKEFMRTFVKNQSLAIYTIGWTWKFVRGLNDDQLRIEYDKIHRAVDLATAKDQHQHLKRSGETLESLESKKLKSSHSTSQPAELQETTSVSTGATISAGDPIPAVTFVSAGFSVSAAFSIPAATPIAAGISTTVGASGSASKAYVPIIELLDSPPKDTSLPLDPKTEE
nr:hypothetical protein [Tanacetum cinerariifolium]